MKEKLIGLIKLIFCIVLFVYAEKYYPEVLAKVGINFENFSELIQEIFVLILYLIMAYIVYALYKEDFHSDFDRFKRKWFPNILMSIVYFGIFTITIWIINYITEVVAKSFEISYLGLNYYNVFNEELTLSLALIIIKFIIIMPIITVSAYVFGINEFIDSKKMLVFLSGIVGAVVAGLALSGSLLFIFFNVIPYFAIYFGLAYIYRKNNENIFFSITTFVLYTLLASLIIAKIA